MNQQSPADALRLFEEAWEETRKAFTVAQDEFAEKLAGARQTLRSCAGNVEKHKANLEQWSEAANARIAALREHVRTDGGAALQEELDALKAQLAAQEEASAARIKELESSLEIAKASAAEHAEALESVKSAGSADADRVLALEVSEPELKGQIAQLEEALQRARSEADTAKAATTVLESDLAEARKRLEEAEAALSELELSLIHI